MTLDNLNISPSIFLILPFKYEITPTLVDLDKLLTQNANRCKAILDINKVINDIKKSNLIEAGAFEYAVFTVYSKNYNENLVASVYYDKISNILSNFIEGTFTFNPLLWGRILGDSIDCQSIAFMEAHHINPGNWDIIIKKKKLKEIKKNSIAVTNLYECPICNERKCTSFQLQIKSGEEPMTTFVDCLTCLHHFTIN